MMLRRLLWTLLLALLLPAAQVAGAAHQLSHATALEENSKSGLHTGHCDICAATTQIGGAAPSSSPIFCPTELRQAAPVEAMANRPCGATLRAFDSRAPPSTLL